MTGHRQNPAENGFLPNFCALRVTLVVVIVAELLAILFTLFHITEWNQFFERLGLYSLFVQWIAITESGLICLLRPWLQRFDDLISGLIAWLLLLLVTLAVSWAAFLLLDMLDRQKDQTFFLLNNLAISSIIFAMLLRYLYLHQQWRKQVQAEAEARLQALQSRIRPHFLFNSMNTIVGLIRTQPKLAEEVVHDLSDLFHASLSDAHKLSTLGAEMEMAKGYLRIESQRLGERLKIKWDIDTLPKETPIPALILQPLLENAIYHGIEPSSQTGTLSITGQHKKQRVELTIRNTLPHKTHESHRTGNQIALDNVRQRLEARFAELGGVKVTELEGHYEVQLFFPHPWNEQ